jgi:hypothetical protein
VCTFFALVLSGGMQWRREAQAVGIKHVTVTSRALSTSPCVR